MEQVRIVLCETSQPGNIGAAARAMKNMGITSLYLVNPVDFPSDYAIARAAGADDLLEKAVVVNSLTEAIKGCTIVAGTSARERSLPWPLSTPRAFAKVVEQAQSQNHSIAIVFGHERNGLSNKDLSLCNHHIHIPCNPEYSSLNLAAAVQIICYELRLALLAPETMQKNYDQLASNQELNYFFEHLAQTLTKLGFLHPQYPRRVMLRLKRLYYRAQVEKKEMKVLRGILSAINHQLDKKPSCD